MSEQKITQVLTKAETASKNGIVTASYADNYIVKGNAFQVVRSIAIGTETTTKFVVDFSEVTAGVGIFMLPLILTSSAAPCHVKTYSISSYTGGTQYPAINLNQAVDAPQLSQAVVKHTVTSSDSAGLDLREYEIGALGNPLATRGGSATSSAFIVIPVGAKLLMEVENYSTTNATFFNVNMTWYEV